MTNIKWIKLSTDLFNNRKIKQIRKLPEGDAIIGVWLQIMCLAGDINNGGLIYFSKDIPYTDEMLATEFERPINIIRLALQTFETFEMIHIVDNVICVSNWEKYQNQDKLELLREYNREKKRESRARQKERQLSLTSQGSQYTDIYLYSNSISNSINNNTNNNTTINKDIYQEYCKENLELLQAFKEWEAMRKKIKKPLTDKAKKLSITALEKITTDSTRQIQIINNATLHCWQSFYDIKEEKPKSKLQEVKIEW